MLSTLTHQPLPTGENILEKILCMVVDKSLSMNQQYYFVAY